MNPPTIHVSTTAELRKIHETRGGLISLHTAMMIAGVSRQRINQLFASGKFTRFFLFGVPSFSLNEFLTWAESPRLRGQRFSLKNRAKETLPLRKISEAA